MQYLSRSHMWQSRVEIEHYSVAYFDRITMFEALKCSTSVNRLYAIDARIRVFMERCIICGRRIYASQLQLSFITAVGY